MYENANKCIAPIAWYATLMQVRCATQKLHVAINEPSMNQQSVKVAATMLDVAKTKRLEAMQRLQKINEKQKVLGSKKMKLLEKAIPSKETTKTKAGASQSGVPRKKTKK